MVQIIEEGGYSPGRGLASGFLNTLGMAPKLALMKRENQLSEKSKLAEIQRKKAYAEEIMGDPSFESLPMAMRKILANEAAGISSSGATKSIINALREQESNDWFRQMGLGGEGPEREAKGPASIMEQSERGPRIDHESMGSEEKPKRNYESEIKKWAPALSSADPRKRDFAKSQIDQLRKEQEAEFKLHKQETQEKQFAHRETADYAKNIEENGMQAQQIKPAIASARKALKNKATGASARNIMYKYLVNKKSPFAGLFQTEDTQAIVTAQKALAVGFRALFGGKPTEREFFWYENILPDLLKSGEVNESILDYFERAANLQTEAQGIYDDIVKKNGGFRPIDIDMQVREKMKPLTDKIIDEGENLSGYVTVQAPNGKFKKIPKSMLSDALENGGNLIK